MRGIHTVGSRRRSSLFAGVGFLAIGCAGGAGRENIAEDEEEADAVSAATLAYTSDSGTAYCATVTVPNALSTTATGWFAVLDLKTNTITSVTGAATSAATGRVTFKPSGAASVPGGGNATFSFCASASSTSVRPAVDAWNVTTAPYGTCQANSGLYPTKAALAVAMAMELGRWQAATDLAIRGPVYQPGSRVVLSAAALATCVNGCENTKGLLGQQDATFVDQKLFNATSYWSDLQASLSRQVGLLADLTRNNPGALPPAHRLTLVSGPSNRAGTNGCGPHYVFQADTVFRVPLTPAQASSLVNALCFYGAGSCGSNPFIGFQVTSADGCPAGRTCIAIDVVDGDTSSSSTTSAGSAPMYPMNRVWDPAFSLLGSSCITSTGQMKALVSKCSAVPASCGYLYCM